MARQGPATLADFECANRVVLREEFPASASANSAADSKRSAGSFSSAVSTAASTCGGTVRRCPVMSAGSPVITLATIACAVGPVKGGSPTSIS
jgi:hypothetical protein